MQSHSTSGHVPSQTENSASEAKSAYFERRLDDTRTQAAGASGSCARASHAGLAKLYRRELSKLSADSGPMISDNPLLEQPHKGGAIELPAETPARVTLSLGWRRNG